MFRDANRGLAACLHTPDDASSSAPASLVICCHGLTGTRVGTCYRFVRLARRLTAQGIACLRFDFGGCGESEGEFIDLSPQRLLDDLNTIVDKMPTLDLCDSSRVGLAGSSFGAFTAAMTSPRIDGLRCAALWAPVADPRELVDRDMTDGARALLDHQGWVEHHGHRLGAAFINGLPDGDGPSVLARRSCPTIIFHSRSDRQVPIGQGRAYETALRAARVETAFHELDGDDHGMRSVATNDLIIEETAAWFGRFL